jgi:hypothetical protein
LDGCFWKTLCAQSHVRKLSKIHLQSGVGLQVVDERLLLGELGLEMASILAQRGLDLNDSGLQLLQRSLRLRLLRLEARQLGRQLLAFQLRLGGSRRQPDNFFVLELIL